VPPDTPYLSVKRVNQPGWDDSSKVAAGMEATFIITFRPPSTDNFAFDVTFCTEREKFIVPVVARGAAAALDFPDVVQFPPTTVKCDGQRTLLVRNIGTKASSFSLHAFHPFAARPATGHLAPGETLQCVVSFTPDAAEACHGELEVRYEDGTATYSTLQGQGRELPVALSQDAVVLLPTYVTKSSQKTFRIANASDQALAFSLKQRMHAREDIASTQSRLISSQGLERTAKATLRNTSRDLTDCQLDVEDDEDAAAGGSEDEEEILADAYGALTRTYTSLRAAIAGDKQLFSHPCVAMTPAEGVVYPRSEVEVVVHFTPDHSQEYQVTVCVDVQGQASRLPLVVRGRGLGPQAVFSYDTLDVGEAYVNALHTYEVELQNRGKIVAEYSLLPPTTAMASKFRFEPSQGSLEPMGLQSIKVALLSDLLGGFEESFHWAIRGLLTPLVLQLKGSVVGPAFEVDVAELDFGIVSVGFR
jgi:hydrocephalus-inducing protein